MGWQIIKIPDTENYQIFSSITDSFLFFEEGATRKQLTAFYQNEFGRQGMYSFERIMEKLDKNEPAYYQFTKTYAEALKSHIHRTEHINGVSFPETCNLCKEEADDEER